MMTYWLDLELKSFWYERSRLYPTLIIYQP